MTAVSVCLTDVHLADAIWQMYTRYIKHKTLHFGDQCQNLKLLRKKVVYYCFQGFGPDRRFFRQIYSGRGACIPRGIEALDDFDYYS